MLIILSIVVLSGLLIYFLLKPPQVQERTVRIARKAPVNKPKYELSIMSANEARRTQE